MKTIKKAIIGRVNVIETELSGETVTHTDCPIILAEFAIEYPGGYGDERWSELAVWLRESKFHNHQFYPSQIGVELTRELYAEAVATGEIKTDGVDVVGVSPDGAVEEHAILSM